jgi:hypothetical protein
VYWSANSMLKGLRNVERNGVGEVVNGITVGWEKEVIPALGLLGLPSFDSCIDSDCKMAG